jgi:hypothetical protein
MHIGKGVAMLNDMEVAGASPTDSASAQSAQSTNSMETGSVAGAAGPEDVQREILAHILQHTGPTPLPVAWSFFPATEGVRSITCSPPELITSLESRFSAETLLAARVLVPGAENEPQLAPVLRDPKVQVLLGADGKPLDLASDAGALFSVDPPCYAYACQRRASGRGPKRVFVASLEDLPVLSSLKLRCTSAAGLATLNGQQVRRMFANLSPESPPRYRLTLVGWSIADFNENLPAHIEPILERLRQIHDLYGQDGNPILFDLWQPDTAYIKRIRSAISFCDTKLIRREVVSSAEDSLVSAVAAWHRLHEPAETDLGASHAALIDAIETRDPYESGHNLQTATTRLSTAINGLTTQRFLQAAEAASNPQESYALLLRAEIIQHLNQSYGPLEAAKPRHRFSFQYDPTLSAKRLEDIVCGINLLLKLERLSPQK